jgi:succinate dehydrogenase/fumarate reductase flavoprotein subunit
VVIGAGIAGQAAAITVALEGNGKKVLLAEKGDAGPNGNSPFCKGTIVWATDEDAFYQYMKEMAGDHTTTPDDVLRAYAKGATENYSWIFNTLGAAENEASIIKPVEPGSLENTPEWPECEHCWSLGKFTVGKATGVEIKGATHITKLLAGVIEQHSDVITYRIGAPMTELVQDSSSKRIIGAVIGKKNIKANLGVIMCTGGFESNAQMMEDYIGQGGAHPAAGVANTGDGHKACMKIGADFWHMDHCAGFWMSGRDLADTKYTNNQIVTVNPKQYGITVARNGRRYYMDWDSYSNKSGDIPWKGDPALFVGSRHGHMQVGGEWPHLNQPSKAWFIFDQAGLNAGAMPESKDPVADKYVYQANTIEELAGMIGTPVNELTKTIAQWNECCANGDDVYFHRPAKYLQPIATAPFYAQIATPAFLNTDGGPVRSAQGEILDPDGKPIPGLYSSGEFGSVWSGVYQGGGNVAECMIFGRISARSALANA